MLIRCAGKNVSINKGFFFPDRRSIIVGAGYIAVEMAGILATLGSKTSLIIRQTGVRRKYIIQNADFKECVVIEMHVSHGILCPPPLRF